MEETDINRICVVYKVVIEYHIYYFPIHSVLALAVHYLILLAPLGMTYALRPRCCLPNLHL